MDEESLVSGSQVESEDDALSKYEKEKRSVMQFNKDINSLWRYRYRLFVKVSAHLKQPHNCEREECDLLRRKVEACREDYDRIKEMIRENNVSERIQSVYDMLSEISTEFAREQEKLYLEYVDAIHMMSFKLEEAYEDNMLLMQKSMDMRIDIPSVDLILYRSFAQSPALMTQLMKYEADNMPLVLLEEKMDSFMSKVDPVKLEDFLLKEKSMNLSCKSCTFLEEKSDVILKLKGNAENVHKAGDHPVMDRSTTEVEERNVVDSIEDEVEDDYPLPDGCVSLGGDLESIPPLNLLHYCNLTQQLHPYFTGKGIELARTLLGDVEDYLSTLNKQENKICDIKQQYNCWEKEVHLIAGRIFEENACYSRQVDLLTVIVSVVTDKYAEKLQTMSSKCGSVIEWMKSRYEFILQENIRLRQHIEDRNKYSCTEKNVGIYAHLQKEGHSLH